MSTKRPDAATRRAQLLDAADAVFAAHGVTAPLELVVAQAGVGRATLYRQFPDRSAIMLALLERSLQQTQEVADSLEDDDEAFFKLLQRVAERIAVSPPFVDYWRTVERGDEIMALARNRLWQVFQAPMQRAVQAGLCRAALSRSDLLLVFGMLGASLRGETPSQRQALARRALHFILEGLRA